MTADYRDDEDLAARMDEELDSGRQFPYAPPDKDGYRKPRSKRELMEDILPSDYEKPTFKNRFRDAYSDTQKALKEAETGANSKNKLKPNNRDISSAEKNAKFKNTFKDVDSKRDRAQKAIKKKQNSVFSRHKGGIIGGLSGLLVAGLMGTMMMPMNAIAQFGGLANWLHDTTQTVHELATGTRNVRNMVAGARMAAKAAVSGMVRDRFQTSRAGLVGSMVGQNYVKQLEKRGFTVHETSIRGVFDGTSFGAAELLGNDSYKLAPYDDPNLSPQEKAKRKNAYDRARPRIEAELKAKFPDLAKHMDISSDGSIRTKPGFNPNYKEGLSMLRAGDKMVGSSKFRIGREIKARYVLRNLGIYSRLHPIQIAKKAAADKVADKIKNYREQRRTEKAKASGVSGVELNAKEEGAPENETEEEKAAREENNAKNKEALDDTKSQAKNAANSESRAKKFSKMGGKLTGIGSAVVMGLCMITAAGEEFVATMLQLTTMMSGEFARANGLWGQIQSSFSGLDGEAIDLDYLSVENEDLYNDKIPDDIETDDEGSITKINSYMAKSWTDSPAYQKTMNGKTISNARVPQAVVDMYEEEGGWAAQASTFMDQIPGLSTFLKPICSPAVGLFMTIIDLMNPMGIIMEVLLHVAPGIQEKLDQFIMWAFQMGTGVALDSNDLDPDQRAEISYRGGEYTANTTFASLGGYEVSDEEAYKNQIIAQEYLDAEFASKPLMARIFDASDYRSTVAQISAQSSINPAPQSPVDYMKNMAKLVGAVPNFLSNGILKNRSAEATAANVNNYVTGAPKVQFSLEQLDELSGVNADDKNVSNYDYDVNYYGCAAFELDDNTAECTTKRIENSVSTLLENDFKKFNDYANKCLGSEINESDHSVKAVEPPEDPSALADFFGLGGDDNSALLVGIQGDGTSWNKNDCSEKAKNDDDYRRIAQYVGMDYPDMAAKAWDSAPPNDKVAQEIEREVFGTISSGSSGGGALVNGAIDGEAIQKEFAKTNGQFPPYYVCSCVGFPPIGGCTTLTAWYVNTFTDLTYGHGHGKDVVDFMISHNPDANLKISDTPIAGSIFSSKKGSWAVSDAGHTGLVVGVDGNKVTVLDTWAGQTAPLWSEIRVKEWDPNMDVKFLYVGDHLKK